MSMLYYKTLYIGIRSQNLQVNLSSKLETDFTEHRTEFYSLSDSYIYKRCLSTYVWSLISYDSGRHFDVFNYPPPKPLVPSSQIHNPLNESLYAHMVHEAHISLSGVCFVQLGQGSVQQSLFLENSVIRVSIKVPSRCLGSHTYTLAPLNQTPSVIDEVNKEHLKDSANRPTPAILLS